MRTEKRAMAADLTLTGLEEPIAHVLRPWIAELAKGEQASADVLRRAAETAPDEVRGHVILTRSIDMALAEAQASTLRLSILLEEGRPSLSLRRPIRAAHTTFIRLLALLRAATPPV